MTRKRMAERATTKKSTTIKVNGNSIERAKLGPTLVLYYGPFFEAFQNKKAHTLNDFQP